MNRFDVLDSGYVELIEHWGSDERIVEAARMSTQKGFQGWGDPENPGDEKLLRYLWKNKHHTPFEMGGMTIEVKAPIFVFREWHRHRTQSYNEMSARYAPLPNENYIPTVTRVMMGGGSNKQAGSLEGAPAQTTLEATMFLAALEQQYEACQKIYTEALVRGVPKELARIVLPVGRYSKMRASANLRNWLAFMTLRCEKSAQWEIRQFADAVAHIIEEKFPRTYGLWFEGMQKT